MDEPSSDDRENSEHLSEDVLGLKDFTQPGDGGGVSLESLSAAYAELVERGSVPYEPSVADSVPAAESEPDLPASEDEDADHDCEISPRSILEAMLFVGNSRNEPLTSERVAALMRGVRPREIDHLVDDLNADYRELGCPYSIATSRGGYIMQLDDSHGGLRDKFRRKTGDARLSQAAVDVLAIVAYRQPLDREEIERLRGRPSGGVLAQLVRRQLIRVDRSEEGPRRQIYQTTERFLQLFGLASVADLPRSEEIDGG